MLDERDIRVAELIYIELLVRLGERVAGMAAPQTHEMGRLHKSESAA